MLNYSNLVTNLNVILTLKNLQEKTSLTRTKQIVQEYINTIT